MRPYSQSLLQHPRLYRATVTDRSNEKSSSLAEEVPRLNDTDVITVLELA